MARKYFIDTTLCIIERIASKLIGNNVFVNDKLQLKWKECDSWYRLRIKIFQLTVDVFHTFQMK